MPKPSSNVVQLNARDARYERQINKIFDELETLPIPFKERVAALYTLERIEIMRLTKAKRIGDGTGSAVRRYAEAFKTNAASRGKKVARSVARDLDLEPDDDDDDPAAA